MALSNIPYFIGPVANSIIRSRAKKLNATADLGLFNKRTEPTSKHTHAINTFYDVLMDQTYARYKSNALPLREAVMQGKGPKDCTLSIAVSGGGLRVVSFLSFLQTLREHDIPIKAYAGTSAGALATMFDRIGVNYDTVWECLDEKLLKSLLFSLNANLTKGILSGNRVMRFIEGVLPESHMKYNELPFLYNTAVLVNSWDQWESVFAANGREVPDGKPGSFSTYQKVVFSREFDPDMPIAKGVFSSMCLPVFQGLAFRRREFTAITEDGIQKVLSTDKSWTVDGGYANNYPVDVLLLPSDANKDPNTHIVINVAVEDPNETRVRNQDLVQKLVYMSPGISNAEELERERSRYGDSNIIWWTIGGKARGVGLFDFDKLDAMKEAGRESAEALLRTVGIIR